MGKVKNNTRFSVHLQERASRFSLIDYTSLEKQVCRCDGLCMRPLWLADEFGGESQIISGLIPCLRNDNQGLRVYLLVTVALACGRSPQLKLLYTLAVLSMYGP
jgi:hypothetical protein